MIPIWTIELAFEANACWEVKIENAVIPVAAAGVRLRNERRDKRFSLRLSILVLLQSVSIGFEIKINISENRFLLQSE